MTIQEAASILGFRSTRGFLRWCRREGLPVIRISHRTILLDREEFEQFVLSRKEADDRGRMRTNATQET